MGAVGAAEGVGRLAPQLAGHGLQVARRQHHVGVEHYQILALRPLRAVVAAHARPGVLLHEILHVEPSGILVHHGAAVALRPVLHYYHLEATARLRREAVEQFVHLVGAVVDGNDY